MGETGQPVGPPIRVTVGCAASLDIALTGRQRHVASAFVPAAHTPPTPQAQALRRKNSLPSDWNHDSRLDPAIFNGADGTWYIQVIGGPITTVVFGKPLDVPAGSH